MSHYVQVGVTAMRDPLTGDFMQSVPLYAKRTDMQKARMPDTLDLHGIMKTLGKQFKEYEDECKKRGLKPE